MASSLDIRTVLDRRMLRPVQAIVILMSALVLFLDGFDTQAISYIAPMIAREWQIPPQVLGPIFSAALVGLMVGFLLISPLSDRFGHKRVMAVATFLFGIFTLGTAMSNGVTEMVIFRFLTGVGLGGAMPSAVALTGEYSPYRQRNTWVLVIYCGFSLGFIAAGMLAAQLLPVYGWRSLMWVGAAAPLLFSALLWFLLPESLEFLVLRPARRPELLHTLRRIDPALTVPDDARIIGSEQTAKGMGVAGLFGEGRTAGTLLLWFIFFMNLAEFYFLQSWLPSVLTKLGMPMSTVVAATTLTTAGGIVAAVVIGLFMDRMGPYRILTLLYVFGFLTVVAVGMALSWPTGLLLLAAFLSGFCVSGGQKAVIALSTFFYPPAMRSTGIGWSLGMGRLGGILGPISAGWLLSWQWSPAALFYAEAVPMLLAGAAVLAMGLLYGLSGKRPDRASSAIEARQAELR